MKTFRLPTLTRGKKIVRNLLAAALLVVFAWGCMDFPISDPHRSFRRAEGEEMVGPSQYQGDFHTTWDGWAVGTYRDQILLHREDFRGFDYWTRNETGPTLLPIPEGRLLDGQAWFVAVDVPEGAASARLELDLSCYYTEQRSYNSARMDSELGDYDSVIRTLAALWEAELPERYASIREIYIEACVERAKALSDTNRPLDALALLESVEDVSKTAKKRLEAYVYRIIGRWKDSRGVEYVFRRDGSCAIAGEEKYFGGSGYEICVGGEPYPTQAAYTVVNLKNKTLTLKNLETGKNMRLNYVGEATEKAQTQESAQSVAEGETDSEAQIPDETSEKDEA